MTPEREAEIRENDHHPTCIAWPSGEPMAADRDRRDLLEALDAERAKVAVAREALVAVERVGILNGCPCCGFRKPQGHAAHCPVGNALAVLDTP
jgi:hypothetical protein